MSATLQSTRLRARTVAIAKPDWQVLYRRRLLITDSLSVIWAVTGTQLIWFGLDAQNAEVSGVPVLAISYTGVTLFFAVTWLLALQVLGARDRRIIGGDYTEYKRVVDASLRLFGAVGIAAFLLKVDLARGYFLSALPAGLFLLFASRWMWRQWLNAQRRNGEYSSRILIVGSESSVLDLANELRRHPTAGFHIAGVCVTNSSGHSETGLTGAGSTGSANQRSLPGLDVPTWGDLERVAEYMTEVGADTVAITNSDELTSSRVRTISWALEADHRHMVIAPSLTDVAGPRIHTRPVAGLPLMHVETPRYDGGKFVSKRVFDVLGASILILILLPVIVAIAVTVKLTSRGPVLYRSERIGRNGEPFGMLKVRSMRVGAEHELKELLIAQGTHTTPLFKVRKDPRITPVGRFLRKYSLDELPQLLNVLLGDMSLVGPRPQIASEVALYTSDAERRLLLKPGMSGLWQVSGRSSLNWDETVRLDLYYVENWSMLGDLMILLKTARAVVAPGHEAS